MLRCIFNETDFWTQRISEINVGLVRIKVRQVGNK